MIVMIFIEKILEKNQNVLTSRGSIGCGLPGFLVSMFLKATFTALTTLRISYQPSLCLSDRLNDGEEGLKTTRVSGHTSPH